MARKDIQASILSIMQQISMRDHLPPGHPSHPSHPSHPIHRIRPTREPNEMPGVWPRSRHVALLVVGRVFVGYVARWWCGRWCSCAAAGASASVSGRTRRQELSTAAPARTADRILQSHSPRLICPHCSPANPSSPYARAATAEESHSFSFGQSIMDFWASCRCFNFVITNPCRSFFPGRLPRVAFLPARIRLGSNILQ